MAEIETQEALLDGIRLDIVDISDSFGKVIARYEFPYVDGADLEDMGQKPRTVKFRCYFFDNAGQATYDEHKTLIEYLKTTDDLELQHPQYGTLTGKIESVSIRHDDRLRCAEIDIEFVEQMPESTEVAEADAVESDIEADFVDSIIEQQDEAVSDMTEDFAVADLGGTTGLDTAAQYDPEQSLLGQITGISVSARAYLRQIDAATTALTAMASEITQPINSIVATVTYATTIPGRIVATADATVERIARRYDGLLNYPARFLSSVDYGLSAAVSSLDKDLASDRHGAKEMLLKQTRLACARRLALETSNVYATDRDARRVQKVQGKVVAFDVLGTYTARLPLEVEPLNVNELELTLATARERLQAEVNEARAMHSLKTMARSLEQAVSRVKAGSERLISIDVDALTPLHLICLQYGLPYTDAERLMPLNPGIRNPSFVQGGVRIYVR